MDHTRGRCSFCGAVATFIPSPTIQICAACARRVADLTTDPSEKIWEDYGPSQPSGTTTSAAAEPIDTERVFEEFKRGVEKQISKADADAHLNLAEAYVQMDLYVDARREAGVAASVRAKTSTTEGALRLLLTAPMLSADGLRRLRERLRRTVH